MVGHPPLFYRHNHYDHHVDHHDNYHVKQQDKTNRKSLKSISSENCGIFWPQKGHPLFFSVLSLLTSMTTNQTANMLSWPNAIVVHEIRIIPWPTVFIFFIFFYLFFSRPTGPKPFVEAGTPGQPPLYRCCPLLTWSLRKIAFYLYILLRRTHHFGFSEKVHNQLCLTK